MPDSRGVMPLQVAANLNFSAPHPPAWRRRRRQRASKNASQPRPMQPLAQ